MARRPTMQPPQREQPAMLPPAERRTMGKGLRATVPHAAHADWRVPLDRVDPLNILRAADKTRQPDLLPLR